jgi:cell wall-associated NlpC family hydrolase
MTEKAIAYFFDDSDRQAELGRELLSWEGTPFRHWAGVKGRGCDCIHLVVRILEHFGFGPLRIPKYDKDWHLHRGNQLLLDGIEAQLDTVEVTSAEVADGDIVLYQFGRALSHGGIYFGGEVYQAVFGAGVVRLGWGDAQWRRRVRKILRIVGHE